MIEFVASNLAPIMFLTMICFLLLGYPIAFSLAANGIIFYVIGVFLAPLAPDQISLSWSLMSILPDRAYSVMTNELLLALPFFTFMGLILERSGMAEDLLSTVGEVFGPAPGGLAYSVVVVGALLAATTGVVAASIIAMGLISLPLMMRYGYSRKVSAGVIIASGTLAQIIPPSIVLIILADQLGRSVGDMYQGALLPGLLLAGLYLGWIVFLSIFNPSKVPGQSSVSKGPRGLPQTITTLLYAILAANLVSRGFGNLPMIDAIVIQISLVSLCAFFIALAHRYIRARFVLLLALLAAAGAAGFAGLPEPFTALFRIAGAALAYVVASAVLERASGRVLSSDLSERVAFALVPPLLLIFLVLGTIFIGIATPTEGGAMGALGAMVLAAVKRRIEGKPERFSFSIVKHATEETARLAAFVMFILIGARIFSMTFYAVNGQIWIEHLLDTLPGGEFGFILFALVLVFILGFFLEFFEIAFVVLPLLVPTAEAMGIDLIWFGVLVALVTQTSYLTPPLGFGLFFLRSVAPTRSWKDTATGRTIEGLTTGEIYAGVVPFIAIQCFCVALVFLYPQTVTHYRGPAEVMDKKSANDDILNVPIPGLD